MAKDVETGSDPAFPEIGFAVEVGDRDHQNLRRVLAILVDDPIGEAVGTAATCVLAEGTPGFGESYDSFESLLDLVSECSTQARTLGLVEPDRIPEVVACGFQKSNGHRFRNS